MYAIVKKALGVLFLLVLASIPMACGHDESRDESRQEPRKETKIGGDKGVVVQHGGGEGSDVKIGGDKGVVVDH
jgi:hypothetical protein